MNINDLLKLAVERKASDLHLKVGSHPMIRVDGGLGPMQEIKRMMQEDTLAMGYSIMNARQKQRPRLGAVGPNDGAGRKPVRLVQGRNLDADSVRIPGTAAIEVRPAVAAEIAGRGIAAVGPGLHVPGVAPGQLERLGRYEDQWRAFCAARLLA